MRDVYLTGTAKEVLKERRISNGGCEEGARPECKKSTMY